MYQPELQEVIRLSKDYNLIPVSRDLMADTETPIRVFYHFQNEPRAFLLESVEGGVNWARYSFIGTDPFMIVRGKGERIEIETPEEKQVLDAPPVETVQNILSKYSSPSLPDFPRFTGGAVGFFGYDLQQYYGNLPPHLHDDLQMNDIHFMFCDQVIVFDHVKQQIKIIANVHIPDGASELEVEQAYRDTCRKMRETEGKLRLPLRVPMSIPGALDMDVDMTNVKSNLKPEKFMENVNKAKDYINAGDVSQVVLSQRFMIETDVSPLEVYRILRTMNPSPYMYYLKLDEETIVGTSPELLVRVEGDRALTRPIAGTRRRGKDDAEDRALEKELLADEKERAEHIMLVDLGKEDISKVSEPGTVECDSFMEVERYSHVMHIVSNVSGKLRSDMNFFDAFLACLPAGTVSGAPKTRAMEIISELEHEARGAYAGAIGYLGFSGNMDSCITIRTIIFKEGKAYVQAGAGIVQDSVPENEYMETVNKAKGSIKAIRVAEALFTTSVEANQDYFYKGGESS